MFSLPLLRPEAKCASTAAPIADGECRRRSLLVRGNLKLGPDILAFSLPAGQTCPGESDACRNVCYAKQGNFAWPAVEALHKANLAATRDRHFVRRMVREINRRCGSVIRWHVSGDIYSAAYAHKLFQIVRQTPDVCHFFYTRSWRVKRVLSVLLLLAAEPNVRQWWSCDRDTGVPFPIPEGIRLAWMMTFREEADTHADHIAACHLIFRVNRCRSTVTTQLHGTSVCPVENGLTARRTHCGHCQLCWK